MRDNVVINKEKADADEEASNAVKIQLASSVASKCKPKNLFEEMGGMDVIKAVVLPLIN